jgi:pilus assembly protein CpaE
MSNAALHGQLKVMVFVTDQESEAQLRDALPVAHVAIQYRRGGLRTAIEEMQKSESPDVIIVDISDSEPNNTVFPDLETLSEHVAPNTQVMAIGLNQDIEFYRQLIRSMGVEDFIPKPITRDQVARHFTPIITRDRGPQDTDRGGRVIGIVGMKGGVGATAITTSLGRFIGNASKRHAVIIDSDLQNAACASYLGVEHGKDEGSKLINWGEALKDPGRIDDNLVERITNVVDDRVHLLMNRETNPGETKISEGAASNLITVLRNRYNYVLIDMRMKGEPLTRELAQMIQSRIAIVDPSVTSLAMLSHSLKVKGSSETQRPMVVLNRAGMKGALTTDLFTDHGQLKVDLEIPDCGMGQMLHSLNLGKNPCDTLKPFKEGIEHIAGEIGVVNKLAPPRKKFFGLF